MAMTPLPPVSSLGTEELLTEQTRMLKEINNNLIVLNQRQEHISEQLDDLSDAPALFGVSLEDIDLPFSTIVAVLVKWSLASIPATIILTMIFVGTILVIFSMLGMLDRLPLFLEGLQ